MGAAEPLARLRHAAGRRALGGASDRPALKNTKPRRAWTAMRRFAADQSGATAIEYAMIAAGIGAVLASTVYSLGDSVKANLYDKISSAF
jgi:pilus assembly protein Flp/PilA